MRLKSLSMRNFRQFRESDIEFSTDSEKNVTVIHGQNGSGKTTLMNAFLWVLFEDLQSLENPEQLVNQGALMEIEPTETVPVEVTLEFDQDGQHHTVTRRHIIRKESNEDRSGTVVEETFTIEYVNDVGEVVEPETEKEYIRQIVPHDLADLFFFDGEYINDLTGVDNDGEIRKAIRKMMGLTILERSIDHLEWVEREFRKELQDAGGDELQELIDKQEEKEDDLKEVKDRLTDKKRKRGSIEDSIADISDILAQLEDTEELEKERNELEEERNRLDDERDDVNDKLKRKLSENGFLTYAMPAFEATAERIEELREEGKIPSELSNEFVDDLLQSGTCICDRDLTRGTEEYKSVKSYKSDVEADGLDKTAIQLVSHFGQISEAHSNFHDDTADLIKEREELAEEIEEINGRIDDLEVEIEEKTDDVDNIGDQTNIDGLDIDDIYSPSDLQAARREKRDEKKTLTEEIGGLKTKKEELKEAIGELNDQIDRAQTEAKEADLARIRMQSTAKAREDLQETYEEFQNTVREHADERVSETFESVITGNFEAQITEEFGLEVYDPNYDTPVPVNKSRGQRQVASLSFIGSLVDLARQRYEDDEDYTYFSGGIYPVVMDSPFGALDNEHRRMVSRAISRLADQVIVMATDSQWEGPVREELSVNIGKQYFLEHDQEGGVNRTPITTARNESVAVTGDD